MMLVLKVVIALCEVRRVLNKNKYLSAYKVECYLNQEQQQQQKS